MHLLIWMRVPGDTIFAIGMLLFTWFVARLWIKPQRLPEPRASGGALPAHAAMAHKED